MATFTDWIPSSEAAEILGVTPGRVRQLIVADEIPSVLIGRMRLLERKAVERFAKIERIPGRQPGKKSSKPPCNH